MLLRLLLILYLEASVFIRTSLPKLADPIDESPKRLSGKLRSKGARLKKSRQGNSVAIHYPNDIFSGKRKFPSNAEFDQGLADNRNYSGEGLISKAQDQEDVWLYENLFFGVKNGIIMESGALNGILFSTSYFFEYFANWTAIHVEADPENYRNLILNRPSAINIHGALCSESQPLHYSSEGVIPVRGFIEFMTPTFIKKWHGKIYNNKTRIEDLPTVQCIPVRQLLKIINIKHIDIWVLDVEGAEESVLKGTNFSAVHINVVAMECDLHDVKKNARKTDILEAHDFRCKLIERNCMCVHNRFIPSLAKTKSELRMFDGVTWSKSYVNADLSLKL